MHLVIRFYPSTMMTKEELQSLVERICGEVKMPTFIDEQYGGFRATIYCNIDPSLSGSSHSYEAPKFNPKKYCEYDDKCAYFMDIFSKETNTKWVLLERFAKETKTNLFRKAFKCDSPTKKHCTAKISFSWKKLNEHACTVFPYLVPGSNCVADFKIIHNHGPGAGESLPMGDLRRYKSLPSPWEDTKARYISYFKAGIPWYAAKILRELSIIGNSVDVDDETLVATLAEFKINPPFSEVRLIHGKFVRDNPIDDCQSLALLKVKMDEMKTQGHHLASGANWEAMIGPFNLVIITPIMKRVYSECFNLTNTVYTITSVMDKNKKRGSISFTRVTFFFTPSKAGALPIGCVMNPETGFEAAFSLFKKSLSLVHGVEFRPSIVTMENQPMNMKYLQAIESNFKDAKRLFNWPRISQSLWCRLWAGDNKGVKEERIVLMRYIQEIFESVSPAAAEENYKLLEAMAAQRCPKFLAFFQPIWQQWAQWCRSSTHLIPEHHHESFESAMIFRDSFLRRCKSLNPVGMVDAVCDSLENYFKNRLLALASPTTVNIPYHFWKFSGMLGLKPEPEVVQTGVEEYAVTVAGGKSTVHTDLWICDCLTGRSNFCCDHLILVRSTNGSTGTNIPVLSDAEQNSFRRIALDMDKGADEENKARVKVEPDEVQEDEATCTNSSQGVGDVLIKKEPEEVQEDMVTCTNSSQGVGDFQIKSEPEEVDVFTREAQKRGLDEFKTASTEYHPPTKRSFQPH